MTTAAGAAPIPANAVQIAGPWTRPGTFAFWSGPLSNFAPTPGLVLPAAYCGHPSPAESVHVATVEHWMQAIKACSPQDFAWVLSAPDAKGAKRRGGRRGEQGRTISLRPDWEAKKYTAVRWALGVKFRTEPYRSLLLLTAQAPIVEASPSDFEWGGADPAGTWTGRNLLGLALMEVRDELHAEIRAHTRQLGYRDLRGCPPLLA